MLKSKAFKAFFLSLILGLIIILPNIIAGNGVYTLWADFDIQQIPFNKIMNYSIKEGSVLWTWYNELGSNFIGTFSFYNLFSPFNIIGYLFPDSIFEYLIGPIFILKYAVAGLSSYLFLKRYVKNKNYAIIGSLLYSFSGFQLTNTLFYHFHDVVAFFPLLLYTLDNLVYDDKKIGFLFSVFICAITNWFFFIGEGVFLFIYFTLKIITCSYKINFRKLRNIFIEGFLGILISSIILIPTYLFISQNPRTDSSWTLIGLVRYPFINYIELLRGFIFPSEIMHVRAVLTNSNYSSTEVYLPFVGCLLFISYIIKKPKDFFTILFIVCCIFMVIPIFNSSFILFRNSYYSRWLYMPILIISLMSVKSLDEKISIKKGLILNFLAYFIFGSLILLLIIYTGNKSIVFDKQYLVLMFVLSIINLIILLFILTLKKEKLKIILIILMIYIFVAFWGNYTIYKYKHNTFHTSKSYFSYLESYKSLREYRNERTNSSSECPFNIGYMAKINNIKSFNSNINGSNFEFYSSIGMERGVSTVIKESDKDLNDFLGIKYVIACDDNDLTNYGYIYEKKIGYYKIYKNNNYKDFGFTVDKYISEKDFNNLSKSDKKKVLNNTVVLNSLQIKKYKNIYNNKKNIYKVLKFKFKTNGFLSKINTKKDTLAIYTIPYDDGWSAEINGKNVNIEQVDNGMMAIKVKKGYNNIIFKYKTPGLTLGFIFSFIGIFGTIVYVRGVRNEK